MDLKEFLEATSPEVLEKLASEAQNDLLSKLEERLLPLLEKTAQYTAYIIKCAGEELVEEVPAQVTPANPEKPITGSKDNLEVTGKVPDNLLDKNMIVDSVREAVEAGKADAIIPFVKSVMESKPDAANEIVKIIKVELQDLATSEKIDDQTAVALSDQLNQLLGE